MAVSGWVSVLVLAWRRNFSLPFPHSILQLFRNGTLPDRSEVGKDFTPECGGKTPRGAAPLGFPDTQGSKTFATEQEGGVMSLP